MTLLAAGVPVAAGSGSAYASAACTGVESDYNGDGLRDTAIADPDATVGGKALAGRVTVVYGGTAGVVQLDQDLPSVPGSAEAGARFGKSLQHADLNRDGCSDLAVGAPYKDVGTARDAGSVYVMHGSVGGLTAGAAPTAYDQTGVTAAGGAEAGDLFGFALTGGTTATSQPFLVIGVPGEDTASGVDSGQLHYLSGSPLTLSVVDQGSAGVWEDPEPGDRFGAALASTDRYFAVGVPGESTGTVPFAGAVNVFRPSLNTAGVPDPVFGFGQPAAATDDTRPEPYDRFGTSVAMVAHRAAADTAPIGAQLAVGTPGEDLGTLVDAGGAAVYRVNPDRTLTTVHGLVHQDLTDVETQATAGDFFGQQVALANLAPTQVGSGATVKLAVGVPGKESSGEHLDKGGVQILPVQADLGVSDAWLDPGYGIPGVPEHQMFAGSSLGATPQHLLAGVVNPAGAAPGAVYGFDWTAVSGAAPAVSYTPGTGGVPAGGTAFGAVVR
ncbi:integrin alpha [Streptomyces sp. NPDC055078]